MEKSLYVLFHTHTEGMKLYNHLRGKGISVRISPAPRSVSVCCGMSLLAEPSLKERIEQGIAESETEIDRIVLLENQIDPGRNRYC